MNATPAAPIRIDELVPYLREIVTSEQEQRAIRSLWTFWYAAVKESRVPSTGAEWKRLSELVDWLQGYEPNPELRNRDAGMFDHIDLKRRMTEVLGEIDRADEEGDRRQ